MADFPAIAQKLLSKKGVNGYVVRSVDGDPPDPDKPWEPGPPVEFRMPTVMVKLPVPTMTGRSTSEEGGQSATDVTFVIAALGMSGPPEKGDVIEFGTELWAAQEVVTVAPAGIAIIYKVLGRPCPRIS